MVVDDDDDIAELLLTGLERAHISAVRARNGDEGVAIVHTEQPAVVLLDWMMPVKDGIQTSLEIRADPTLVQPHIIMVTARAHRDDQQHARRCGIDDIIPKPFRTRDLIARVRDVLPD